MTRAEFVKMQAKADPHVGASSTHDTAPAPGKPGEPAPGAPKPGGDAKPTPGGQKPTGAPGETTGNP
jgi:hypothetical protein